jgi:hypothetical protein
MNSPQRQDFNDTKFTYDSSDGFEDIVAAVHHHFAGMILPT